MDGGKYVNPNIEQERCGKYVKTNVDQGAVTTLVYNYMVRFSYEKLTSFPSDGLNRVPRHGAFDDQVTACHRSDLGHLPDVGQPVHVDPRGVDGLPGSIAGRARVLAAVLLRDSADVEVADHVVL